MQRGFATLLLLLVVGGCAYKHRPLYNVDTPLPAGLENAPANRLESALVVGAGKLGWHSERVGPCHLLMTETIGELNASVDVWCDQQRLRIVYNTSTGMMYDPGPPPTIHSHYDIWVHNLERNLYGELAALVAPK